MKPIFSIPLVTMVSKKNIKNIAIFYFLRFLAVDFVTAVTFLFQLNKINQNQIAEQAGVSRPYVSHVITGKRDSEAVKKAITEALGFNPWAFCF